MTAIINLTWTFAHDRMPRQHYRVVVSPGEELGPSSKVERLAEDAAGDPAWRPTTLADIDAATLIACALRGLAIGSGVRRQTTMGRIVIDLGSFSSGKEPAPGLSSVPPSENDALDAKRYRRLRVIGAAPSSSVHLENRTCLRFTNLDAFVDGDIKIHPSRGEPEIEPEIEPRIVLAVVGGHEHRVPLHRGESVGAFRDRALGNHYGATGWQGAWLILTAAGSDLLPNDRFPDNVNEVTITKPSGTGG